MVQLKTKKQKGKENLRDLFYELNDPLVYGSALVNPLIPLLYLSGKRFSRKAKEKSEEEIKETQSFGSKPVKKQEGGLAEVKSNIFKKYPRLENYLSDVEIRDKRSPSWTEEKGQLEFFPKGEEYSPDPSKTIIEVYNPNLKGEFLERAILGDMLHGLPNEDQEFTNLREKFRGSFTQPQMSMALKMFIRDKDKGPSRGFNQAFDVSILDAFIRGGLAPDERDEWGEHLTKEQKTIIKDMENLLKQPIKKQEGGTITTPPIRVTEKDDILNKPVSLTNNEPRLNKSYGDIQREQLEALKTSQIIPRSKEEIKEQYPLSYKYFNKYNPRANWLRELGGYFTPGVTNIMSKEDVELTKKEIKKAKEEGDFGLGKKALMYGTLGLDYAGMIPLEVMITPIGAAIVKAPINVAKIGLKGIRKVITKKPKNLTEQTLDNIAEHRKLNPQAADEYKHMELGRSAHTKDELAKLDPEFKEETYNFYIRDNQNMYSAAEANIDKLNFGKQGKIQLSKIYKDLVQLGTKPKELDDMGLNILRDDAPSHLISKGDLKDFMRYSKPNIDKVVLRETSPINLLNPMKENIKNIMPSTTEGMRAKINMEDILEKIKTRDPVEHGGYGMEMIDNYFYLTKDASKQIKTIRDEITPAVIKNDAKAAELKYHINQLLETFDHRKRLELPPNIKNPRSVNRSVLHTQLGDNDIVKIGAIGPPSREVVLPGGTFYRQFSYVYSATKGQQTFKGTHSRIPNELMFVRTTDRITGKNGASSLHSEALQSDFHQQARAFALENPHLSHVENVDVIDPKTGKAIDTKKVRKAGIGEQGEDLGGGYVDSAKSIKAQKQAVKNTELQKAGKEPDLSQPQVTPDPISSGGDIADYTTSYSLKMNKPLIAGQSVDAPFKDTREWLKYTLKDMIKVAVKENKDMVTFSPPDLVQAIENLGGEGIKAYSITLPRVINEVLTDITKAARKQFPQINFQPPKYVAHGSPHTETLEIAKESVGRDNALMKYLKGADQDVNIDYPKSLRMPDANTFLVEDVAFIDLNNFSKNAITEIGRIYNNTKYQNKGYSKEILKKLLLPKYKKGGLVSINTLTKSLWQ